jgi:hypothetical protein
MKLKKDTIVILVVVAVAVAVYWYTQGGGGSTIAGTSAAAGYKPNDYNDGSAG